MGQSLPCHRWPVLVIEDEPLQRIDIADMVEGAGFSAVEATSVAHAIRTLERRLDIRVVYMNLDMPRGIKGIEIAAAIRDLWPPIDIILTAAFFKRSELALPARAEFYPKPIRRDEVIAAMRRMVRDADALDARTTGSTRQV